MAFAEIANLATSIISSFLAQDTVAVYTQDFTQVFRDARAIKAVVKERAKVMEHPVESGAIITDHRIILPTEIDLSLILTPATYRETYDKINQYYLQGTLLIVQTRSGIYVNQLIHAMPHEEDPNLYNTITLALGLKEVQFVTAQFTTTPRNTKNSNGVNRGVQQPTAPTGSQSSALGDVGRRLRGG
jgi:hypothetical protein